MGYRQTPTTKTPYNSMRPGSVGSNAGTVRSVAAGGGVEGGICPRRHFPGGGILRGENMEFLKLAVSGKLMFASLLNLSAAFDTVDHATLIRRLQVSYQRCSTRYLYSYSSTNLKYSYSYPEYSYSYSRPRYSYSYS